MRTYDESTTSNGVNARIYNNRIYRDSSSSERYKRDIAPISAKDIAPERLYDAEVVQFKYKDGYLVDEDSRCDKLMPGFIVEKLKEVYPIAIDYNEDGLPEMWNANILLPAMLKLIQDLKRRIDEQDKIINKLSDKENCFVIGILKKYQDILSAWTKATPNVNEAVNRIVVAYEDIAKNSHLFPAEKLEGLEDAMMDAVYGAIRFTDPLSIAKEFENKTGKLNEIRYDNIINDKTAP